MGAADEAAAALTQFAALLNEAGDHLGGTVRALDEAKTTVAVAGDRYAQRWTPMVTEVSTAMDAAIGRLSQAVDDVLVEASYLTESH